MSEQKNGKAKVFAIDSRFDEKGKMLPVSKDRETAEVTYLEDQMPIHVLNNTVEIDLINGTKTRKDSEGKVLSTRALTPEEKAKYSKQQNNQKHTRQEEGMGR